MALEGTLRDFNLDSLFNMVKIQGKGGTLVLSRHQEFIKVFFENGEVIGCDSNQIRMEDRIGSMLVRLGRISEEELRGVVAQQRATLKRLGSLLLETGKASEEDLNHALFNQAMTIILQAFRWTEGDYRFDTMLPPDLDREHFPPIPVDTILMEAARLLDEWPAVQRRLPPFDRRMKQTPAGQAILSEMDQGASGILEGRAAAMVPPAQYRLNHEQEIVLSYFDEPRSVSEILRISRFGELDSCAAVAELMGMGLVEPLSAEEAVGPSPSILPMPPVLARKKEWEAPSNLLWPLVGVLIALPLLLYVPKERDSINLGMASLQPADALSAPDMPTLTRMAWVARLAGGSATLAPFTGMHGLFQKQSFDFKSQPDPMAAFPPAKAESPKAR